MVMQSLTAVHFTDAQFAFLIRIKEIYQIPKSAVIRAVLEEYVGKEEELIELIKKQGESEDG